MADALMNPKALKARIVSTQATRRITSAMKMVAVTKLKKAQDAAEQSRPYADRMAKILSSLTSARAGGDGPALLVGTGSDKVHLLVVVSSDRGLCGGFNGQIVRAVRLKARELAKAGKTVKLMLVGRKAVAALKREFQSEIIATFEDLAKPAPAFTHAEQVMAEIFKRFEAGEFDVCTLFYNRFISAVSQKVTTQQMIPFAASAADDEAKATDGQGDTAAAPYEFEPDEETIIAQLLPQNLKIQLFSAFLDSFAGEQAARMVAMDNATRNASEMIQTLTVRYNRVRQAIITKELIEIISGAEAL